MDRYQCFKLVYSDRLSFFTKFPKNNMGVSDAPHDAPMLLFDNLVKFFHQIVKKYHGGHLMPPMLGVSWGPKTPPPPTPSTPPPPKTHPPEDPPHHHPPHDPHHHHPPHDPLTHAMSHPTTYPPTPSTLQPPTTEKKMGP